MNECDDLDTYNGDLFMTFGMTSTITRTRASCRASLRTPTSTNLLTTLTIGNDGIFVY